MNSKKEVQHVYLVGAKSLGAYGGYETFVYKLTEYHQNECSYDENGTRRQDIDIYYSFVGKVDLPE